MPLRLRRLGVDVIPPIAIGSGGVHIGKFLGYGLAALGLIGSIVALCAGLMGRGPGPQWLWIIVAYVSLFFAGFMVWLVEHRRVNERVDRTVVFNMLDSKCLALMSSAAELRKVYPHMGAPIKARTWLPEPTEKQGDKAALHRFNGRLDDFLEASATLTYALRVKLPIPTTFGDLESVEKQLTEIHNR